MIKDWSDVAGLGPVSVQGRCLETSLHASAGSVLHATSCKGTFEQRFLVVATRGYVRYVSVCSGAVQWYKTSGEWRIQKLSKLGREGEKVLVSEKLSMCLSFSCTLYERR